MSQFLISAKYICHAICRKNKPTEIKVPASVTHLTRTIHIFVTLAHIMHHVWGRGSVAPSTRFLWGPLLLAVYRAVQSSVNRSGKASISKSHDMEGTDIYRGSYPLERSLGKIKYFQQFRDTFSVRLYDR